MAFTTTFRRLFTVRLLHGYYLDERDKPFFELDPTLQAKRLTDYDISKDLTIEPTEGCRRMMERYKMKWRSSETGFFVGAEIRQQSGIEVPFSFPLKVAAADKEVLEFAFKIKIKNRYWSYYSNMRLSASEAPYRYFFGNDKKLTPLAPTLSEPVAAFTTGRLYEMGELAIIDGILKQALEQTNTKTANKWQAITDFKGVNESDKKALPKRFDFQLPANVKNAKVNLKSSNVDITSEFKSNEPLKTIALDFLKAPDGIYQLTIKGDAGFNFEKEIFLSEELSEANCLGVIHIIHKKGLPDGFNILTPQNGVITEGVGGRIFDIRFLNRLTYRKIHDNANQVISKNLKPSDDTLYIYDATLMILRTKQSYPLTKTATKLTFSNGEMTLPEPAVQNLTKEEQRLYSEIFF